MRSRYCHACADWHDLSQPWPHRRENTGRSSTLATPMLIRDNIDPLWHPADGKCYESKSEFRAVARQHGLIEVGNEVQKDTRTYDEVTKDDVGAAIQKVNQGYKPEIHGEAAGAGWTETEGLT